MLLTFDNILDVLNLDVHYYVYNTFRVLALYKLRVICNFNRFHSSIFILSLITVHNFKMCIGDTGTPEQSLVLL